MSKIICDVCGTSYPETVEQCPICGCVRPADVQGVLPDSENPDTASGYTHVKGGRFSKSNVRKRVKAAPAAVYHSDEDDQTDTYKEKSPGGTSKGLVATAIIMLIAILAVVVYITMQFFAGSETLPAPNQSVNSTTEAQTGVSCTELKISNDTLSFAKSGDAWMLNVNKLPADTTDELVCQVADESVATAEVTSSDKVKITAVGSGETTVTITCGDQSVACKVVCEFDTPAGVTTEQTTEATEDGEYSAKDIIFNSRYNPPEATLRSEGETWNCYKGKIPVEEITWKSDDESVATVKDGIVTAVGAGKTEIHAIWGDIDLTCTVRCNFITTPTGIQGSDDVGEA